MKTDKIKIVNKLERFFNTFICVNCGNKNEKQNHLFK